MFAKATNDVHGLLDSFERPDLDLGRRCWQNRLYISRRQVRIWEREA